MAIGLLSKTSLTFERDSGDGFWQGGKYIAGGRTSIPTTGNLQPFRKGDVQSVLPEGLTANDARTYLTSTLLQTTDQFTETKADETTINGLVYVAFFVEDWSLSQLTVDNYEVTLVRKDKATGVL